MSVFIYIYKLIKLEKTHLVKRKFSEYPSKNQNKINTVAAFSKHRDI